MLRSLLRGALFDYSKDDWTEMDKKDFNELKNNLGFFNKPNIKNERVDEYPQ